MTAHVWASARLRGACSRRPKSPELTLFQEGLLDCLPPRQAAQDNRNPLTLLFFFCLLSTVHWFVLSVLHHAPPFMLRTLWQARYNNSRAPSYSLCDNHRRCFSVYVYHPKKHNLDDYEAQPMLLLPLNFKSTRAAIAVQWSDSSSSTVVAVPTAAVALQVVIFCDSHGAFACVYAGLDWRSNHDHLFIQCSHHKHVVEPRTGSYTTGRLRSLFFSISQLATPPIFQISGIPKRNLNICGPEKRDENNKKKTIEMCGLYQASNVCAQQNMLSIMLR